MSGYLETVIFPAEKVYLKIMPFYAMACSRATGMTPDMYCRFQLSFAFDGEGKVYSQQQDPHLTFLPEFFFECARNTIARIPGLQFMELNFSYWINHDAIFTVSTLQIDPRMENSPWL